MGLSRYNNVSEQTVFWVANRDKPINDTYGFARSTPMETLSSTAAAVKLTPLSFDYPTDTLMAFMKLGLEWANGMDRFLTSWKSKDDPGPGNFTYRMDPTGYPQLFLFKNGDPCWRCMRWNRRSRSVELVPFDPKIKRTLHRLRREAARAQAGNMANRGNNNNQQNQLVQANVNDPAERPMEDFAIARAFANWSSIQSPAIQARTFEIKPFIMQMIQSSVTFRGTSNEDPHEHLSRLLDISDSFRPNGVLKDAVRLKLFQLSLRGKARTWLFIIAGWIDHQLG
ncbi:hypothetical protein CRG98_005840 [Punica granatum]|uniref:Uncharacterized protein n=1 Tax=Punica granatum TaxID=22663 RepID=A0A2I0KZ75_PUNGR|nr:hypothetical protein CRG98_005840 [Punica granatum]